MPTDWLGLYPELSSVLPQINQVDNLLWLLNEELGRWFLLLRGPSSAAQGIAPKLPPASVPKIGSPSIWFLCPGIRVVSDG